MEEFDASHHGNTPKKHKQKKRKREFDEQKMFDVIDTDAEIGDFPMIHRKRRKKDTHIQVEHTEIVESTPLKNKDKLRGMLETSGPYLEGSGIEGSLTCDRISTVWGDGDHIGRRSYAETEKVDSHSQGEKKKKKKKRTHDHEELSPGNMESFSGVTNNGNLLEHKCQDEFESPDSLSPHRKKKKKKRKHDHDEISPGNMEYFSGVTNNGNQLEHKCQDEFETPDSLSPHRKKKKKKRKQAYGETSTGYMESFNGATNNGNQLEHQCQDEFETLDSLPHHCKKKKKREKDCIESLLCSDEIISGLDSDKETNNFREKKKKRRRHKEEETMENTSNIPNIQNDDQETSLDDKLVDKVGEEVFEEQQRVTSLSVKYHLKLPAKSVQSEERRRSGASSVSDVDAVSDNGSQTNMDDNQNTSKVTETTSGSEIDIFKHHNDLMESGTNQPSISSSVYAKNHQNKSSELHGMAMSLMDLAMEEVRTPDKPHELMSQEVDDSPSEDADDSIVDAADEASDSAETSATNVEGYTCPECNKPYVVFTSLIRHIKQVHEETAVDAVGICSEMYPMKLQCTECPRRFRLTYELDQHHVKSHGFTKLSAVIAPKRIDRNIVEWTKKEIEILKSNWNSYFEKYAVADPYSMVIPGYDKGLDAQMLKYQKKLKRETRFYEKLGEGLNKPERTIYRKAKMIFNPEAKHRQKLKQQSDERAWTTTDENILRLNWQKFIMDNPGIDHEMMLLCRASVPMTELDDVSRLQHDTNMKRVLSGGIGHSMPSIMKKARELLINAPPFDKPWTENEKQQLESNLEKFMDEYSNIEVSDFFSSKDTQSAEAIKKRSRILRDTNFFGRMGTGLGRSFNSIYHKLRHKYEDK